jgi:hypothetical protein
VTPREFLTALVIFALAYFLIFLVFTEMTAR